MNEPNAPLAARKPLVSLVIPCYNESEALPHFLQRLEPLCQSLTSFEFEWVFIDDGSKDNTWDILTQLCSLHPHRRALQLSRNFGKEAALSCGIHASHGEAVIPLDCDLQDPPELIQVFLEIWQREGFEVVLAQRVNRDSDSWMKRLTAHWFYRLQSSLSRVPIPANVGDFRLMDRCVVEQLKQLGETERFMKGLFAWVGFKTKTVPFTRPSRVAGSTQFSGWKLWNFALDGITSFSTFPLRIWTYLGALIFLFNSVYIGIIMLRVFLFGVDVPGYASLLVVHLSVASLQFICLGVLGEYIGRIYMESKKRPVYIVRKSIPSSPRT